MHSRGIALAVLLLAIASACGGDPPDRLGAARAALNDALVRRDVTALRRALSLLRQVDTETPEAIAEVAGLMMQAGETAQALWLLEAGIARFPERDDLRLGLAVGALVVDDPVRALATLEPVGVDSELHLPALMLRARSQLELGDLGAALALFEAAEQQYPDSPHAVLARVATLLQEGRVDEARSALAQAREAAATSERIRELDTLVAQLEFARGDREAGLERMRELVVAAPSDVAARRNLVRALQAAALLDEALEVARAGLASDPQQPVLQSLVARTLALQGRPEEAEAALRRLAEETDSPSAHLLLARFLAATDPPAAAEVLSRAAAAHPDAIMLRMHECEAWLEVGDRERARAALAFFRRSAPEDPHVRYLEARLALAAGDAAGAAAELREVVSDLDRAYTQFWLARALEAGGDDAGAQRRYALALRRDRNHPAPAVALIRLAERSGDWPAAAENAAQLVARAPVGAEGYALLVTSLARAGAVARAEAAARTYAERFPERHDAQALLAMSQRAQGKLATASEVLDAAEARLGPAPELLHERALIQAARGEIEAGMRTLGRAIAERPDEPDYRASLALLAYEVGDVATGDAAVDVAMSLDPTDPAPLELRASYRAERRDWAGATADIERTLALRPRNVRVHFMRGVVAEKQGRTADAVAAYRRAIELQDGAFAAHNNLALLLLAQQDIGGAVRSANRAYARAADNPQVLATLGAVYLERGLATRALAFLEQSLALAPGSAEAQRQLALAKEAVQRSGRTKTPVPAAGAEPVSGSTETHSAPNRSVDSPPRNIVLVVVDTLRPDWTTPYGDTSGTSPELARWAAHGVVFERVLAQSSWTKVSVASMMSSLWPVDHGVRDVRDALGDGAQTLAEQFQAAGYATYGVQSNGWLASTFGFQQGFDHYVFPRGAAVAWMKNRVWPHADNVYLEAERLLDAHDPAVPFFLYLHFMDVHEYAAPAEFKRFGTDSAGAYRAAIRWTDHVLERLREKLSDEGLLDTTVLVLASDHGETFGEDRHFGHARNAKTPALRVPLVMRLPEAAQSVRVRSLVRNLDLAPTLLELAGVDVPAIFEGRSLLPLIRDASEAPVADRLTYASLPAQLYHDATLQESVSTGSWSLVRNLDDSGREALFDLVVDPDEEVDLIAIEPEAALRLRPLLDSYQGRTAAPGAVRSDIRIDPRIAEKLRAVGYLQ